MRDFFISWTNLLDEMFLGAFLEQQWGTLTPQRKKRETDPKFVFPDLISCLAVLYIWPH